MRCGKLYKAPCELKPRACIAVKGIDVQKLPAYCSRDVVSIKLKIIGEEGRKKRIIVCSAYFDRIDTLLLYSTEELVQYCQKKLFPIIVGCDSNEHHMV